jgi:hypothetical protein
MVNRVPSSIGATAHRAAGRAGGHVERNGARLIALRESTGTLLRRGSVSIFRGPRAVRRRRPAALGLLESVDRFCLSLEMNDSTGAHRPEAGLYQRQSVVT